MTAPKQTSPSESLSKPTRRALLAAGGVALAGFSGAKVLGQLLLPRADVFVARNQKYDGVLVQTIRDGLAACGFASPHFAGKRVLLKPNMVEPTRQIPHMTTHPAVIIAAAEVFRQWGATVTVGEAPGHVRDTEMALVESGVAEALLDSKLNFADLNYEEVAWRVNRGRVSPLKGIYFPRSVCEADYVVSLPKMKTHHWVGITCAMKNFYGTLPGIKYGWPKNVLHHNGIPQTVVDINASLPKTLAIVDAIDCMEGDGPIMGSMKHMGLVLVGSSLPAVDATAARIMGLRPERVSYLQLAADRLGPIAEDRITQRGEHWQELVSPFTILDEPHLNSLRATLTGQLVS
ncbi:DUF362 domain-containing protein [Bythopirellula polymerisocia]|uniref:DUF362 domain-containing protein n=1 Tax=Bythopirellula polymerisocia TaxID=2528003 RepID=A0A5C6CM38_9BACT|nr:DUF362 domain-containing protein [Bythopirellula polymerisocia]TWU25640.1 hypothetical protein Pla144_28480 [Bythopirellula polymerisocia]